MEKLESFLKQRPAIRLQYDSEGSFSEYIRHFKTKIPISHGNRIPDLIVQWAKKHVNVDIDEQLLRFQLKKYPICSSADHAGVMHNKILLNSNFLLHGILDSQALPYHLVFATTRIPLNNISNPSGILFQNRKLHFFSSGMKSSFLCFLKEGLQGKDLNELFKNLKLVNFDSEKINFLRTIFFEYVNIVKIINESLDFSTQISKINSLLWPLFFKKNIRDSLPKMIYIPTEYIVENLAISDIKNKESKLYQILFNASVRDIYLEEFNGIQGAWTGDKGTHFFWGRSASNKLIQLRVSHDKQYLVPFNPVENFNPIHLDPESIIEALEQKEIIASLFIEMYLIAFVENYTLLGGFNQVTYLAWMRVAHERAMLRMGEWAEAAKYARTPTDGLICGPIAFPKWDSGIDMLWDFNSTEGKFHGSIEHGLDNNDIEDMMLTPFRELIKNGIDDMLEVIE